VLKGETQTTGSPAVSADRAWRCAACGKEIAADRDRIPLEGAATRSFVNPAGIEYVIAGFKAAAGCAVQSESSPYLSWFAGFSWQIAGCAGCAAHLGWRFTSASEVFYGLILDRLIAPSA